MSSEAVNKLLVDTYPLSIRLLHKENIFVSAYPLS